MFLRTSFLAKPNVASFKLLPDPNLHRMQPKRFAKLSESAIITTKSHLNLRPKRATMKKSDQRAGATMSPVQKIRISRALCLWTCDLSCGENWKIVKILMNLHKFSLSYPRLVNPNRFSLVVDVVPPSQPHQYPSGDIFYSPKIR